MVFKIGDKLTEITFKLIGYDKRKLNNIEIYGKKQLIPENQNLTFQDQVFIVVFLIEFGFVLIHLLYNY